MVSKRKKLALLLAALLAASSVSFPPPAVRAQEGEDSAVADAVSAPVFQDVSADMADAGEQEISPRPVTVNLKLTGVYQFGDFPADAEDEIDHYNAAEGMTDAGEAELESYLYQEMKGRSTEIDVSDYRISAADSAGILADVINEHPDLYYVGEDLTCTYDEGNDTVSTLSLTYAGKYDEAAFQAAVKKALSVVKPGMNDLQKAMALHDYLADICVYDLENYQNKTIPWESHSAYGALVLHVAVCQGYALAYQHLLKQAGIVSLYVSSKSMDHAWNLVKLGGNYYHVDITWDDTNTPGEVRHWYFLCSDQQFQDSEHNHHDWRVEGNQKASSTTYDNAFWKKVDGSFIMTGKTAYYIDEEDQSLRLYDFTKDAGDPGTDVCRFADLKLRDVCGDGIFLANDRLYFHDSYSIYSLDPNASAADKDLYEEFFLDGQILGGMELRDGKLYYLLGASVSGGIIKEAPWYVLGRPDAENSIAVGEVKESYGNILWAIDKLGNLVVKGTGDFAPSSDNAARAPWHEYADQILSADILVSGMKDASYLFADCKNLECVSLRNFDPASLMSAQKMLSGCDSLNKLYTPRALKTVSIELPAGPHDTWYTESRNLGFPEENRVETGDEDYEIWGYDYSVIRLTAIPQNIENSIRLKKSTAYISASKSKTLYVCGEEINLDDLKVIYVPREKKEREVNDFTTNADKIDMSTPGTKQLVVRYRDFECTIELLAVPGGLILADSTHLYISKNKKDYMVGDILNLDDLRVFYCEANGKTAEVTDYETNGKDIDMRQPGVKKLTVTCRGSSAFIELTVAPDNTYYSIRFNSNGADWGEMESQLLQRGSEYKLPPNQYQKAGYHFDGWSTVSDGSGKVFCDGDSVTDIADRMTVVLYACWKPNTYTVRFERGLSDASGVMAPQSFTYDSAAELSSNEFTYSNFIFAGWRDSRGVVYKDRQVVANLTMADGAQIVLTAQWEVARSLVYVLGEGAVNSPENPDHYPYSQTGLTLKDPLRPGYEFLGWYKDKEMKKKLENGVVDEYVPKLTVYAKWKAKTVSVEYLANRPAAAPASLTVKGTMQNQTFEYGSKTKLKKAAYKINGYTFKGWNTRADGSGASYGNKAEADLTLAEMESPVKLYAQWEPVQYRITYCRAENGKNDVTNELPLTYNVESGNSSGELSLTTLNGNAYQPVRPGYNFGGWYRNSILKKKVGDSIDVSAAKNVKLYAKWTPRKIKVTFEPNWPQNADGRGRMPVQTLTYTSGKTKSLVAAKYTVDGYVFIGWDTDPQGRGAHYNDRADVDISFFQEYGGTVTLYAQWEKYAYKITYANAVTGKNDVSGNDNPPGHNGEESIVLKEPVRDGYQFAGWYLGKKLLEDNILFQPGSKNVTLTAKWRGNSAAVTFDANMPAYATGVKGTMAARVITCGKTKKLPAVGYKIAGYTFRGWSRVKNPGAGDVIYPNKAAVTPKLVGGDMTLYAQWKPIEYKITYENATVGKDGVLSNDNPAVYTMDSSVIVDGNSTGEGALCLAEPTRTGYTFAGWYTDKNLTRPLVSCDTTAQKKLTFYAKWVAASYTIVYDANGGVGDPLVQTAVYDKSFHLLPHQVSRPGYTFYGWSPVKEPEKGDAIYADRAIVTNLTPGAKVILYAQWK